MGRPADLILLTYENGSQRTVTQAEAAKQLGFDKARLLRHLSGVRQNDYIKYGADFARLSRLAPKREAKPVTSTTRRKNIGQDQWVFDVERDGVPHVVTGMAALSELVGVGESTLRTYIYNARGQPVTRYMAHKKTTICRRPLPTHEILSGGPMGRPLKDTGGHYEYEAPPPPRIPHNKLTWRD